MFFLHPADFAVMAAIVAGVLVPELIVGFERWKTLTRLGILVFFCIVSTFLAVYLQHADPGASFTRAFLIGITSRILLVSNHATDAYLRKLDEQQEAPHD